MSFNAAGYTAGSSSVDCSSAADIAAAGKTDCSAGCSCRLAEKVLSPF